MATFLEDQSEKSDMIFNSKIVWILLHFPCYSVPFLFNLYYCRRNSKKSALKSDTNKSGLQDQSVVQGQNDFCKVSFFCDNFYEPKWDSNCVIEEISSRLLKRSNRQKFTARSSCHPPLNHLVWWQLRQQQQKRLIFSRNLECSDEFQFVSWKIQ